MTFYMGLFKKLIKNNYEIFEFDDDYFMAFNVLAA